MSALKSRKARAILAGGVVLGVGATMTLAAWSDSEWATGTFGTGGFTFQGSTTGQEGSFADHPEGDPAALSFTLDANNLTPGDSVTAPFWVKATGAGATVTVKKPTLASAPSNLTDNLLVEYFANNDCTGTAAASGTLSGSTGTVEDYNRGAAVNGVALPTCIKVSLDNDYVSADGESTGAVVWEFAAETA